jgi:hypothetical protein
MSQVLLVTIALTGRSGTEVVCCETAHALRRRGHAVAIYVQRDGATADGLRAEGFEVVSDLAALGSIPDVIQANQTYPLLEAVARFPDVPAISVCHDATVWYNEPIDLPSIRRHVAVDLACRDRISGRFPHLDGRIVIFRNAVDLDCFQIRAQLPARPQRALTLAKQSSYLDALCAACSQRGVHLDVVGPAVGDEIGDLPARLPGYELVFASARSALEAMAAGCAVVVIDGRGLAGMVTQDNVASWHENNFGARVLSRRFSAEAIAAEIDRYDASDARGVCDFVRTHSSLEDHIARLEQLHQEVIAEARATPSDGSSLIGSMARAFRALAEAQQRQTEVDFQDFAYAREKALGEEYQARLTDREAKLRAEYQSCASTREVQFRNEMLALQNSLRARDEELQSHLRAREELQGRLHAKEVEFRAYRDWVAPRNLGRRVAHKLRRVLSGK